MESVDQKTYITEDFCLQQFAGKFLGWVKLGQKRDGLQVQLLTCVKEENLQQRVKVSAEWVTTQSSS
jgi:hypothetical protein